MESKPTYSVWTGDEGMVLTGASYEEAVAEYKEQCSIAKFNFDDDIGYEAMDDKLVYTVKLLRDVAVAAPEETECPEGEPERDSDGTPRSYWRWAEEEAPDKGDE